MVSGTGDVFRATFVVGLGFLELLLPIVELALPRIECLLSGAIDRFLRIQVAFAGRNGRLASIDARASLVQIARSSPPPPWPWRLRYLASASASSHLALVQLAPALVQCCRGLGRISRFQMQDFRLGPNLFQMLLCRLGIRDDRQQCGGQFKGLALASLGSRFIFLGRRDQSDAASNIGL